MITFPERDFARDFGSASGERNAMKASALVRNDTTEEQANAETLEVTPGSVLDSTVGLEIP